MIGTCRTPSFSFTRSKSLANCMLGTGGTEGKMEASLEGNIGSWPQLSASLGGHVVGGLQEGPPSAGQSQVINRFQGPIAALRARELLPL